MLCVHEYFILMEATLLILGVIFSIFKNKKHSILAVLGVTLVVYRSMATVLPLSLEKSG